MDNADAAIGLLRFLEDVGDAPEVIWEAALAVIARGIDDAREARFGRFRHYPAGQLRRLREEIERGLKLAGLGVAMIEAEQERDHDLAAELAARAAEAGRERRRAQTLPAQLARLEKQRRQREGLPTENFHLRPDYPKDGLSPESLPVGRRRTQDAGDAEGRPQ